MLILFLNKTDSEWIKKIERLKSSYPHVQFEGYFSTSSARSLIKDAEIVITARLSNEEIMSSNIKWIIVPMAGVNALDWEAVRKKNIVVSNCHANASAVAERAFALALALLGRIVEFDRDLRYGIWHGYSVGSPEEDQWSSLRGKAVCIVGMGHIGEELAKLLQPFGCNVIGVRRSAPKQPLPVTSDLDWAIEQSEVIFITLPLTRETRNLFDSARLRKMKGKYLINVSRGDIVDERALFEALRDGTLAGAAIDTWYLYPRNNDEVILPSRYALNTLKNVVLSPHVGGFTQHGTIGLMNETFQILENYLKTGEMINRVDPEEEY
ncbi:MAG: 2-hydroxyacid dehydrogenase [Pseudothermotoga sp.]